MNPTVLVVDDEHDLVNLVRYNLEKEGFRVLCAYDGTSALDLVWNERPQLVVLDLMLPDLSGYEVCQQIKADDLLKSTPVIMLTARSAEQDRIFGFETGAEDYVVKPFSPKELVLRVKAMLARTRQKPLEKYEVGDLLILPNEFRVLVKGKPVSLTQIEFQILMILIRHPNIIKTREQILEEVWKEEASDILDRTVDAHVKRLRSKLGDERDRVETVRGFGYKLVADEPIKVS